MSGNPFRRTPVRDTSNERLNDVAGDAGRRFPALDTSAPPVQSTRTKKVRIQTPPHSPPDSSFPAVDDSLDEAALRWPGSPPPGKLAFGPTVESPTDPFARERATDSEGSEETELTRNTMMNSGGAGTDRMREPVQLRNPFQKTLASMEPAEAQARQEKGSGEMAKPSMDVDSFARMLMTGNVASTSTPSESSQDTATQPARTPAGLSLDNSSSTDTSSVSRQSIFESRDAQLESPRSSYEISVSDDDERAGLMETGPKPPKKNKPPPPKRHHGKAVPQRGPQTVSFSDFAPSFSSQSPLPSPGKPVRPGSLNRMPSDLNKPLPPPPSTTAAPEASNEERSTPVVILPADSPEEPSANQPSKQPPPVPLSRRHSQLRSGPSVPPRAQSSTEPPRQVDDPPSYPASIADSTSSDAIKMAPPPPPPTRRHRGSNNTASKPDIPSLDLPSSKPPSRTPSIKSPPPAPQPRRLSGSQRASPSAVGPPTTSPPPLPPPRRNSRRSSLDLSTSRQGSHSPSESRRTSGEVLGGRRASGDEERRRMSVTAGRQETVVEEGGILEDMMVLQREVDALRERYRRAS